MDTPLLVLDEATAFADPDSEAAIQRALAALTRGRTLLVIAHRLHTVARADRVLVLDRGRVAETGTHDELLAAGGVYARMWDAYRSARILAPRSATHGSQA
jgi:ATP-binding cassette subfamily B protein